MSAPGRVLVLVDWSTSAFDSGLNGMGLLQVLRAAV